MSCTLGEGLDTNTYSHVIIVMAAYKDCRCVSMEEGLDLNTEYNAVIVNHPFIHHACNGCASIIASCKYTTCSHDNTKCGVRVYTMISMITFLSWQMNSPQFGNTAMSLARAEGHTDVVRLQGHIDVVRLLQYKQ